MTKRLFIYGIIAVFSAVLLTACAAPQQSQYPPQDQYSQGGQYQQQGQYPPPRQYPPQDQYQQGGQYPPPQDQYQQQGQYPPQEQAPSTAEQNKGAIIGGTTGAVAGGIIGGVIGHQTGNTGAGVVIGALLGGLTGAAVGHYGYDQKRTEEQAQAQYNYDYNQSQSNLVRIESSSATPDRVYPGDTVNLNATYTVLGPQGTEMDVTETREVRLNGELQGKPQVTVRRRGGTYESKVPLILPQDAPRGTYIVTTTIQSGQSSDTRETRFSVS